MGSSTISSNGIAIRNGQVEAEMLLPVAKTHKSSNDDADQFVSGAEFRKFLRSIDNSLSRIADHLAPQPDDIVGTPYVAKRLGCTTAWITQLIHEGKIPKHCLVEGTGNGKVWKLHRRHIENWIVNR